MPDSPPPVVNHLPRARLRMRRWLMASGFYWVGLPFAVYGWQHGQLAGVAVALFALLAIGANLCFYLLIATGRSARLREPSMTAPQILVAMLCCLMLVAGASDPLRPTISLGLLGPLLFGVFQLDPRGFVRLALLGLSGYGLVLLLIAATRGIAQPVVDLTHWLGLALILTVFVAICSEVARMRQRQQLLLAQLQESADRDPLTGLYNRRWLARQLPPAIELAQRHHRPYSVCMVDIDHFKPINDRLGHLAGDAALQWVSRQMQQALRQTDALVRVGGEEFLLLLPETSLAGATELAERICESLAHNRFLAAADATPLQITLSIGVAPLLATDNSDHLLFRADTALYAAKQQGRNRVVSA